MALSEEALGNLDKARSLYFRALDAWEELFPGGHINIAIVLGNISNLYLALEDAVKAIRYGEASSAMYDQVGSAERPEAVKVKVATDIARAAMLGQDLTDLAERVDRLAQQLGSSHPTVRKLKQRLANEETKQTAGSDEIKASSVPEMEAWGVGELHRHAKARGKQGDFTAAIAALQMAIVKEKNRPHPTDYQQARLYADLGRAQAAQSDARVAVESTSTAIFYFNQACAPCPFRSAGLIAGATGIWRRDCSLSCSLYGWITFPTMQIYAIPP